MVSLYAKYIKELAPAYDPRHIEAYMRVQYSMLDHLDRSTFRREVKLCAACVDEGGKDAAEQCARSYGL